MKKIILMSLICALPYMGKAQITSVGLLAGLNAGVNKTYAFQAGNYSIMLNNMNDIGGLNFGAFVEHNLLTKYSLSHSVILHHYYPNYFVTGSPAGNSRGGPAVFAITYNGLLRLFNKGGVRFLAGPGIDINSLSTASMPNSTDEDLNEILAQLQNNVKPIVYYIGAELGYRAGRIDIALKYNYSLNSFTQPLAYQGETYGIPTRSAFLFLNIGFLVFDKNLRDAKKK
ncbi:MAG: hypothetical protein L3J06_05370 [Cyclobacteriaceae bacterium]|nr:hypothetical protein [Cyclobacteriaceae bacterium]